MASSVSITNPTFDTPIDGGIRTPEGPWTCGPLPICGPSYNFISPPPIEASKALVYQLLAYIRTQEPGWKPD